MPNGVPGTDRNTEDETTYVIPDEAAAPDTVYEEAATYLPAEEIITKNIPYNPNLTDCYIYLTADYSGVEEKDLEEMRYIDNELKNAASEVIVTGVNRDITEKTFRTLAEHATQYLGDASAVVALVSALPFPEGVSYGETELTTGDTQKKSLRVKCDVLPGNSDVRYIDYDVLRFDGVMLFATIENLEECVFALTEEDGSVSEEVVYNREELTEWLGFDSLWKSLDGEELQSWLTELHQRVIMSASYEYFAF